MYKNNKIRTHDNEKTPFNMTTKINIKGLKNYIIRIIK